MLSADQLQQIRTYSKDDQSYAQLVQLIQRIVLEHTTRTPPLPSAPSPETVGQKNQASEPAALTRHASLATFRSLSHQLRTPLNAILGMTGLLLETELTLEQHELAEIIARATHTLNTLLDDVLLFSTIEAGALQLEQASFDLRECIEDAITSIAPQAAQQQHNLSFYIEDSVPFSMMGDAPRLRQALVYLLGYVLQAASSGDITLSVMAQPATPLPPVPATSQAPLYTHQLDISIRDTSLVLSDAQLAGLFQPFETQQNASSDIDSESRLRMAISQQLVYLMGGTTAVQSIAGEGTTFLVHLLVAATPGEPPNYLQQDQDNLHGKHVLLIEPHATSLTMLARRLQSWGMLSWTESSIAAAIARLQRWHAFDLVILDAHLLKAHGSALISEIHEHYPTDDLPLVLLASPGTQVELSGLLAQHIVAVLERPVRPGVLFETLLAIVSGSSSPARAAAVVEPAPEAIHPAPKSLARLHSLRILVAEDSPTNQRVATLFLERLGYRVDIAATGLEVLAMMMAVKPQPYDVILMDVHMPELDGLETTRRIRTEWPHHEQPDIIALSANTSPQEQQRYLAMGMDGCLDKSARLEELAAALGRYATRSRQPSRPSRQTAAAAAPGLAAGTQQEARHAVQRGRSPIDMRVIEHLQGILGSESQAQLAELITIFLSHTGHFFGELEQASSDGRMDTLQHIAHTLKSSSANLGAIRLSRLCRELELACRNNDPAGSASSVAHVCEELRLVHEALAAMRDG